MKHVIKELMVFGVIILVGVALIAFLIQRGDIHRGYDTLDATVDKKELKISSPVYGVIENLSLVEGQIIHKSQILCIIAPITDEENQIPQLETDIYHFQDGKIYISSPVDGIIAQRLVADHTTIKALDYFITIQPFDETFINVDLPSGASLSNYQEFYAVVGSDSLYSRIEPVENIVIPVQNNGSNQFVAVFTNRVDAKYTVNDQSITVMGKRTTRSIRETISNWLQKLKPQL